MLQRERVICGTHKNLSENKFALIEMFQDKIMYVLKMWCGAHAYSAPIKSDLSWARRKSTTSISLTHYSELSFAVN